MKAAEHVHALLAEGKRVLFVVPVMHYAEAHELKHEHLTVASAHSDLSCARGRRYDTIFVHPDATLNAHQERELEHHREAVLLYAQQYQGTFLVPTHCPQCGVVNTPRELTEAEVEAAHVVRAYECACHCWYGVMKTRGTDGVDRGLFHYQHLSDEVKALLGRKP